MSMIIQHNMSAWNAERQFNIVTKAKSKKSEKLSSGYRINRAADDAAGLSISEKMRRQIRGYRAGTENAQTGISWVQIGEGALNEAHDIMHRMNELTIKAQNGTNTATDRAFMQAEFEQLQSELDRISTTTTFNDINIFEEHEPVYDQIAGNIRWDYEEFHEVRTGKNQLTIAYRESAESEAQILTITVPPGKYTTHELIDEIDDAFGIDSPIHLEFTEQGVCRLNLENGEVMDSVSGGLTYLLWDNYDGGGYGTLIGTTEFFDETTPILEVVQGQNNEMTFWIEYFDGVTPSQQLTIDLLDDGTGGAHATKDILSKKEVIRRINAQIDMLAPNSGLKADNYGEAIQLYSSDGLVTGFKGNMFKLEVTPNDPKIYHSAFYDNIREGYIWQDPAFVAGGAVLTTDTRDKEHNRFYIDASNDTLVLYPNPKTSSETTATTIKITQNTSDGYTAQEMVDELNRQFAAAGIDGEVQAHLVRSVHRDPFPNGKAPDGSGTAVTESVGDDRVYFEGVEIRTVKEGPDAIVAINKEESTAYDTLFTIKNYNTYGTAASGWDAKVDNETRQDYNAYAYSAKTYDGNITIKNNVNDKFKITLTSKNQSGGSDFTYTREIDILASGSKSMSVTDIANAIQGVINSDNNLKNRIVAEVWTDNAGQKRLRIRDKEDLTLDNVNDAYLNWTPTITLDSAGNNAGYQDLFQEEYYYYVDRTVSGTNSLTLTVPSNQSEVGNQLKVTINGETTTFNITGAKTAAQIKAAMEKTTPIEFSSVTGYGTSTARSVNMSDSGETTVAYWAGGKATGSAKEHQGRPGVYASEPAQLTIGPFTSYLKNNMVITEDVNDTITLNLNGQGAKVLKLTAGTYATPDALANELQKQIDNNFGDATGWGRATVDVVNGQFVLTSTVPKGRSGADTSIEAYASDSGRDNKFFTWLNTVQTAAKAVSDQKLNAGTFTLTDGVDDTFTFTYKDSTGTHTVSLDLVDSNNPADPPKTESFNKTSIVQRIKDKLAAAGAAVDATMENDRLVLITKEKGDGTSISYSMSGASDENANKIFDLSSTTTAQITLDKALKTTASFANSNEEKTFRFQLDGAWKEVKIKGGWTSLNDLIKKLNDGPTADKSKGLTALGVTASHSGGKLVLTKNTPGSGSLHMDYANGGTVMGDMFGYEAKPNVTISVSGNNLTIKAAGKIAVDSATSAGLVAPTRVKAYADDYEGSGFHSAKFSTLTSTALDADGYELNRWNNDLKFQFTEDGGTSYKEISVVLPESTPGTKTSLSDIKDQLQAALDAAMGGHKIEVLLDTNTRKLSLKSVKAGSQFQFLVGKKTVNGKTLKGLESNSQDDGDVGGGFFHHVMCRRELKENDLPDPTDVNGDQFADDIFAQGRHDLVLDPASLHPGMSDTLILDLNYISDKDHNGVLDNTEKKNPTKISLELKPATKTEDWLTSSASEVLNTLREEINEAIKRWNESEEAKNLGFQLNEGLIEVDIGRHDTGVWGNKDEVSISFTMTRNPDIATPAEGYFYIDGIRGNAAYETFYYTEGDLIPAYIIGTKDISKGVTLGENDNDLFFLVDGELKEIDLSMLEKGRKYSADEIVRTLSDKFKEQDLPLTVSITKKGALKISFDIMGKHSIEQVTGSARNELFFQEHSAKRLAKERQIRVSSNEGDWIEVYSPRFSTSMLNINSICISTIKNAEKATNRLKEAIKTVSEMRNTFGAIQNRIEHTINNNRNKEENTQAAESRIRDADISNEMVEFSNLNIIQQAGQAVLAQANQSKNLILSLLG